MEQPNKLHTWQMDLIAEISREVNNDIREFYKQERSHQLCPTNVIAKCLGEPLDPVASHKAWREFKIKEGWTGGEYDQEKKTHPNLLGDGWEDLPFSEKVKDFAFYVGVHAAAMAFMTMNKEGKDVSRTHTGEKAD